MTEAGTPIATRTEDFFPAEQRNLFWFILACVLFCTALMYVITRSPFGDALRAIRENRRRAEFTGLWVKRYELTAFIVAGAFGAIAGGLTVVGESQIAETLAAIRDVRFPGIVVWAKSDSGAAVIAPGKAVSLQHGPVRLFRTGPC